MVPRHSVDTNVPLPPRLRYSIAPPVGQPQANHGGPGCARERRRRLVVALGLPVTTAAGAAEPFVVRDSAPLAGSAAAASSRNTLARRSLLAMSVLSAIRSDSVRRKSI